LEFIEERGNNFKKHCGPSVSKFWVSLKKPLNTEVLVASKEVGLEVKVYKTKYVFKVHHQK